MGFSLGLALYRLTTPRRARHDAIPPPRPAGQLVWLHSPGPDSRSSMQELARRLIEEDAVSVLLTTDLPETSRESPDEVILADPPPETPQDVRAFLDHWRPEVVVMAEADLRPILMDTLAHRQLPALLVGAAGAPRLAEGRRNWFPGLMARSLDGFAAILVRDQQTAEVFRQARAPVDRLRPIGPLEEASAALACHEPDRVALALALATRPVWLAIGVPDSEEQLVIAAHREALKLAHRLVLILAPEDPGRIADLARQLETDEGWHIASRALDEEPDPETEVYLVENGADNGLWYRLAPVVYLGGGLSETGCRSNPMEAAALGSAMILGPRQGSWGRAYGRLAAANAARMVSSALDLNLALSDLLGPDRAARQAQAAWAIASEGTEATQVVLGMIRSLMDGLPLALGAGDLPALPAVFQPQGQA